MWSMWLCVERWRATGIINFIFSTMLRSARRIWICVCSNRLNRFVFIMTLLVLDTFKPGNSSSKHFLEFSPAIITLWCKWGNINNAAQSLSNLDVFSKSSIESKRWCFAVTKLLFIYTLVNCEENFVYSAITKM